MTTHMEHAALSAPQTISVTSPAFAPGKPIPREYSGYGEDVSPALKFTGIPTDAQALAIVMDDPDAPGGTFTHWTAWDLANVSEIPRAADIKKLKGTQGRNGMGTVRYAGPKPPSGTHHYRFRIFALSQKVGLPHGAPVEDVWRALEGKVRAWGELTGTYTRT